MNIITTFEIGIFNAWLPILVYLLFTMLFSYFLDKDGFKRGGDRSWIRNKKDKLIMSISGFIYYGTLLLAIWIPLKMENSLFFTGLIFYALGLVLSGYASISFVTAPKDQLITQGAYMFSRNPIYVVNAWIMISVALMSASWLLIILLGLYLIFNHFTILAEERYCEKIYGEEYLQYKNKTPRYLFF